MKPRINGVFRYVRHSDAETYMQRGWMFLRDLGPTHGEYSALWWHCGCVPQNDAPRGTARVMVASREGQTIAVHQ